MLSIFQFHIYVKFSVYSCTNIEIEHLQRATLDFRMTFCSLKQPSETAYTERNHVMQVTWQLEYNSAKSELPKLTDECSLEYAWGCSRWMITFSGIWSPCNLHVRYKGLLAKSATKPTTPSNNGILGTTDHRENGERMYTFIPE